MTPERLEEIRKIAEAATPGPWKNIGGCVDSVDGKMLSHGLAEDVGFEQAVKNAAFIAAANPQTILALLDQNKQQREALEKIARMPDEENEWDGRDKFKTCRQTAREAV